MIRSRRILIAACLAAVIISASMLPVRWKSAFGMYGSYSVSLLGTAYTVRSHVLAHSLAYGGTALVLFYLVRSFSRRALLAFALAVLALTTEGAEHTFYGARFEWDDVATDIVSVVVVLAAIYGVEHVRKAAGFRET